MGRLDVHMIMMAPTLQHQIPARRNAAMLKLEWRHHDLRWKNESFQV
jgi:hypothetical protein